MSFLTQVLPAAVGLLVSLLACVELGRRLGRARLARDGPQAFAGLGAMEGAVFGLMGLLLAFTFAHSSQRFDDRRQLLVQEANDLGTAWLRLDVLHDSIQPAIRARFRSYLDMRLSAYRSMPDLVLVQHRLDSAAAMQRGIWDLAVAGARRSPVQDAALLVLPSLNAMFDIATTRSAAMRMHTPTVVFALLGVLTLACALLAGVAVANLPSHSWVHVLAFAVLLVAALYLIIDLEFPRFGLVRIDGLDEVLDNVRAAMGS